MTECEPVARLEVDNIATPESMLVAPICARPSRNVAVPVGAPVPDLGAIVAVKVTLWPVVSCVLDAVTVVIVAAGVAAAGVKTKTVAEYAGKL